eukprot:10388148-Lingulodinium_polyedra.AAC.1
MDPERHPHGPRGNDQPLSVPAPAEHFLKELDIEETDLFGSEGTNVAMRALYRDMATCYGWERLLHATPSVIEVQAFFRLSTALMP